MKKNNYWIKPVKLFGIVTFLLLFTWISPAVNLYQSVNHKIELPRLDNSSRNRIVLSKDTVVEQTIYLQGRLKSLELYIDASMVQKTIPVNVLIRQGEQMDAKELLVDANFGNRMIGIDVANNFFQEGTAVIHISCDGDNAENAPAVYASCQVGSGLPNLSWNGTYVSSPISMAYTVLVYPTCFLSTMVCLISLFIIILAVSYLLVYNPQVVLQHSFLVYMASFFMIFLCISARQPSASFLGEPKSEAAYDFWYSQVENGFFKSLMRLEAGLYLSWIQRFVTFVAVSLFPVKYVFAGIQVITLAFISGICSIFCMRCMYKYFKPEVLVLFSVFLGTSSIMGDAYMMHSLGYWSILIVFWVILQESEPMHMAKFVFLEIVAIVISFSKLFVVAWIPVCIFYLVVRWRYIAVKKKLFYFSLSVFSIIHICYIFISTSKVIAQRQGVGSFQVPEIVTLIQNLFYYQVQAWIVFFHKSGFRNGAAANVVFSCLCIGCISYAVYLCIKSKKYIHRMTGLFMLGCWILGFSATGVCILGGLGSIDMRAEVDWTACVSSFSVHWIYLNIPILFICMSFLFVLVHSEVWLRYSQKMAGLKGAVYFLLAFVLLNHICSVRSCINIEDYPVEWNKIGDATENEAYYIPVNAALAGAELVALQHNSIGKLFGFRADGSWNELEKREVAEDEDILYAAASVDSILTERILSVTVCRANGNFRTSYTMLLMDTEGEVLKQVKQNTSEDRDWMTFILDEPIANVSKVQFVYTNTGRPAFVRGPLNIGVIAEGVHS